MELSVGFIVFLIALALYAWNYHNNQVLELKRKKFEQEQEIARLKTEQTQSPAPPERIHTVETIREKERIVYVPFPVQPQPPSPPPRALLAAETFVQVIFKKNGKRRYDYYLGDNYDVRVGDFVEVYVHDKWTGKQKWRIAKVLKISAPGEVSRYANSTILCKTAKPRWWR